jgi:protein gp37
MGAKTIISWATHTWNPATGCSKVSEECAHCYAETLSLRRGWTTKPWTVPNAPDNVRIHPDRLRFPFKVKLDPGDLVHAKYPLRIFVNSMSDLFHPEVPDDFIAETFEVMNHPANAGRIFQVLTKRPERAAQWPGPWGPNIWMGTTCGHRNTMHRIDALRATAAQVRFVSGEPLLTPLAGLNLAGIHQVIAGGESGAGYRPMDMAWCREIRDAAVSQGAAFFFKQDAAFRTETRCYLVEADGSCWQWRQFPHDLSPPVQVQPDSEKYHGQHFHILESSYHA